jgi:hypothetical protein
LSQLSSIVAKCQCILTSSLARATVDGPVVVAVVVHGTLAVEEEPVGALLEADRAVGALEEVVAQVRVRVRLLAVLLGAPGHSQERGALG